MSSNLKVNFFKLVIVTLFVIALVSCGGGGSDDDQADGDLERDSVSDGDTDKDTSESDQLDGDEDLETEPDKDIEGEADEDLEDGDEEPDSEEDSALAGSTLEVTPAPAVFNDVEVGSSGELTLTLTNAPKVNNEGATLTVSYMLFTASSSASLAVDSNCAPPFEIETGDSVNCNLSCTPVDPGSKEGILRIVAADGIGDPAEYLIDVSCPVLHPISFGDPAIVEFGFNPKGVRQEQSFSIANAGAMNLEIKSIELSDDTPESFSISTSGIRLDGDTIQANELIEIEIAYQPDRSSNEVGWLEIESDDPYIPLRVIPITGRTIFMCPQDAPTLEGSSCIDQCVPRSRRCVVGDEAMPDKVEICLEDGSGFEELEECGNGLFCYGGYCVAQVCDAEAVMCHDGSALSCLENGSGFEEAVDCGEGDECTVSTCTPGSGCGSLDVSGRCEDENSCTDDSCDTSIGCVNAFNQNSCDDNNPCTVNDACSFGQCRGALLDCDDGNSCTADSCNPESTLDNPCLHDNVEGDCNDNSACTTDDHCDEGQCVGNYIVCDDNNFCTDDNCQPDSGCVYQFNSDTCDDSNACTENDRCQSGTCRGDTLNPDDGEFCNGEESCDPLSGLLMGFAPSCNDGIVCTVDSCDSELDSCKNTPDDNLCNDNNPCTIDTCEIGVGCVFNQVEEMTPCDFQGNIDEYCVGGLCTFACTSHDDCYDGIPCTEDNCDSYTGFCQNIPHDEWCFNASICDGSEICSPITGCAMGTEPLCDDGIACTFDTCDEIDGGCTNEPVNYLCNDNNPCTLDLCMPGDGCENIPIDVMCDDGNPCTLNDHCFNGTCISGLESVDCDDANPCTTDTCDGQGECLHSYNAEACDDGDPCTLDDLCFNGSCIGSNSSCDDGIFCNGAESCNDEGGCIEGLIPSCDDGVACTVDICKNDIDQCVQTPDNTLCDDGSECTIEYCDPVDGCIVEQILDGTPCGDADMYCYQGLCVDTCRENSDCDDNVYCTIDECDSEMGLCIHSANDSVCQNEYVCDGQEICHLTFDCIEGEAPSCDDGLACTEDTCEEGRGCINTPDTLACDDGNPCTEDVCSAETDPLSNPSGCFNSSVSNGACDDGDPCTSNEHCMAGVCVGDETNCDDGNPCTADYCDGSGVCHTEELANGSTCGSGIAGRICLNGQCITGCTNDSDCKGSDEVACTLDYCDPNTFQCQHMAYDQFCDDGLFCNGLEYCDETLGCQAGVTLDCNDQIDCTHDYCDEDSLSCRHSTDDSLCDTLDPCTEGYCTSNGCLYANTDYECNDGNPCTTGDRCTDGVCEGETLDCNDNNQCTEDSCVDFVGCVYTDISSSCDDQNPCTEDFCLPASGCTTRPYQSKACDNGNQCTTGDWCKAGQCVPGPALSCNDFNPCTNDSCVAEEGCLNEYIGDDQPCDITLDSYDEYCSGGQCVLACNIDEDCNDHIDCTDDSCSDGFCQYTTSNAACDDGVFCNGSETCSVNYGCIAGDVPTCNDDNECTADFCDEVLDQCSNQSMNSACDDGNPCTVDSCGLNGCEHENLDAVECSDGNFCTVNDICIDGVCQGNLKSCDDMNACTGPDSCDPESGCVNPPAEDGTLCAEDTASCMGGICTRFCEYDAQCDDGVDCTKDYCNIETRICTYEADDSFCDDGLFCNGAETCHKTLGCQLAEDLPCRDTFTCTEDYCNEELDECSYQTYNERCDDFNPCTEDSCSRLSGCSYTLRTGQQCADENPCTEISICDKAGHCIADTLTDCGSTSGTCSQMDCDPVKGCMEVLADNFSDCGSMIEGCSDMAHCINGQCVANGNHYCNDNKACTIEYCDDGECIYYANNDTSIICSDNDRCTIDDGCMLGNCMGIEADCNDDNPCTDDSCSEEQGCEHAPAAEGQTCSIDSLTGSCHNGICSKECTGDGECDDGIACTTDTCKQPEGYCQYELNHAACNDNLYCNGEEICVAHIGCVDNIPIDCSDGLECTTDTCDEETNQCTHSADHTVCDLGDTCTAETCDLELGCIQEKLSGPACENDNPCFGDGYCHEGLCVGEPTDCDDDNPCTADSCNPFSSGCENVAIDGIDCNDGNACTINDTCSAGTCSGTEASCDDYNPCTYDYCDPVNGCVHIAQTGVPCDDDNQCTTEDYCFEGQCMGFERLFCNDDDPCTKDSCQPDEGCIFVPDEGVPCEDGNACTVGDKCHNGTCKSGNELNCNDNNPCTGPDSCDTQTGCLNPDYPDETSCDLNPLYAEACISGLCVSYCTSDIQCNDGIGCTQNVCNIETHTCEYNPVDSLCSDGLYCNGQEVCDPQLGCKAGQEIICDDDIGCTDDICNESDDTCLFVPQDFICNDYDHCTTDTCDIQSGCINTPITGNGCDPE